MICKNKKAFTLVELLVVIAILAILATVTVVGYSSLITKGKMNNDEMTITQWNTLLRGEDILNNKPNSLSELKTLLTSEGYKGDFTPESDDCYFYYNYKNNSFYLIEDTDSPITTKYPSYSGVFSIDDFARLDIDRVNNVTINNSCKVVVSDEIQANDSIICTLSINVGSIVGFGDVEYAMVQTSDYSVVPSTIPSDAWKSTNVFTIESDDSNYYYFFARYSGDFGHKPSDPFHSDSSYSSCFVAGTKITMADGSLKNIEDIVVGDEVLAYDVLNKTTYKTVVLKTFESTSSCIATITLNNGTEIKCTPSHPLLTQDGFKSVNPNYNDVMREYSSSILEVNDEVILEDGIFTVESISLEEISVPVYNFHVLSNGNNINCTYFANGVVVHNACGC